MKARIAKEWEFWLLVLVVTLYCWRPLFGNETFYFRDLGKHFMLSRHFVAEMLRQGQLPLWNPNLHGGQPFLANLNNVPLYPTVLLYAFLPMLTAFNLEISLHLVACAAAAYLLARVLGASRAASFVAGAAYTFCGYTLSCATFLNRILAAPYLPLLLLAWHTYLAEGKRRFFLASALCGALFVLAGAPETTVIGFGTILFWSLVHPAASQRTIKSRIIAWLFLVLFTAGLSAVQILPTLEMTRSSERSTGVPYEGATQWSLDPRRLPELILPGLLGPTDTLQEASYWGGKLEDDLPYIPSIYWGAIVLLAVIAAGTSNSQEGIMPARTRRLLLAFSAGALLLSFGRHLPGYRFLYEWAPFVKSFRFPVKFLNAAVLPAALLAAWTFDHYFGDPLRRDALNTRRMRFVFAAVGILLVGFLAALALLPFASAWFQQFFFLQPPRPDTQAGIVRSFGHASLFWILMMAPICLLPALKPSWRIHLILALLILDLFTACRRVNPTASRDLFIQPAAATMVLRNLEGGRLFRATYAGVPIALKAPTNDAIWKQVWETQVLYHSMAGLFGIPVIYDFDLDQLAPRELASLGEYAQRLPWDRKENLLDVAGVTVVMTHEDVEQPGLQRIADIPSASNVVFHLYRNSNAVRRVQFCSLPVYVRSSQDALAALVDPRFRPHQHVILMEESSTDFRRDCPPAHLSNDESSATSTQVTVTSSCPGWLVFSEPYDAGWSAKIDRIPAPILRANYAFSAVRVEAGTHVVERRYLPRSVILGSAVSLLFALLLAGAGVLGFRSRDKA